MKKEILKSILIITLCVAIVFILLIKKQNKFVYVEDDKQGKCYKCVIVDNKYYCQTFISKESEK